MLFDFFNIPISFQNYVPKILAEKLDVFVIVYLNNILIYRKDAVQSYVEAVRLVFEELWKYGLFANLEKCCFH